MGNEIKIGDAVAAAHYDSVSLYIVTGFTMKMVKLSPVHKKYKSDIRRYGNVISLVDQNNALIYILKNS